MPIKVHLVKAMVFPTVMNGCESWIIKKAEHQIIDAFELWCWRRLLRVPWTARRSNQSIWRLWTWEGWGQEEKGMTEDEMAGWHHWLNGRESEWSPGVGDGQGGLACCSSWGHKESDMIERLNWTNFIGEWPTSFILCLPLLVRFFLSSWVGLFKFHLFFRTQSATSFLEPCCDICFLRTLTGAWRLVTCHPALPIYLCKHILSFDFLKRKNLK